MPQNRRGLFVRDLRFRMQAQASGFQMTRKSYPRATGAGESQCWFGDSGCQDAPLVFFVHGTGNDALFPHEPLFLSLLSAGIDVFTFDLDGHGYGNHTELKPDTLKTCLADALTQASRLQKAGMVGIGYSLGGALLMESAVKEAGHGFESLVFISVPVNLQIHPVALMKEGLSLLSAGFYRHVNYYGLARSLPAIGRFRRDAFPVRLHKEFGVQRDYPFLIRDLISGMQMLTLADKLSCPALFCYGSADGLAPADQGQLLATECPESTFLIFPGETHFTTPLSRTFEKEVIHWIRHKATTPTGKAKVT